MKKKLLIAVPVLVVLAGGYVAKTMLLKPAAPPPPKIAGQLVTLDPEFLVNLQDGHYGKLTVALEMTEAPVPEAGKATVSLDQGAAIRARVTDALTGLDRSALIDRSKRHALQRELLRSIKKTTDEPVTGVLFTDIAVQ